MSEPCNKEDKLSRIESDIMIINDRLNRHSEKIDKISDNNLVLETIMKRLEEDSRDQKQNNAETQKTMLSIQGAMTEITFNIKGLNTKFSEVNERVDNIDEKFNNSEDKSKVDIREIIKSKIVPFMFGGGLLYAIMEVIKNFIK